MKIDIRDVLHSPGSKLEFSRNIDLSKGDLTGDNIFLKSASVKGIFCNRAGVVTLDMRVETKIALVCDRCLQSFTKLVSKDFHHAVTSDVQSKDDVLLSASGVIDIDELTRENVLLDLPSKILCHEDCKGLCIHCGCNLNETAGCQCEQLG